MVPTKRAKILTLLENLGPMHISDIVRRTEFLRKNVGEILVSSERKGHLISRWINKSTPTGGFIKAHFYYITEKGKAWLKEQGP